MSPAIASHSSPATRDTTTLSNTSSFKPHIVIIRPPISRMIGDAMTSVLVYTKATATT